MTGLTKRALALASVGVLGAGCERMAGQTPPPPVRQTAVFVEPRTDIASVAGYVWDMEAFWFTAAHCGERCPWPPLTVPGIPNIERALVKGAQVKLFDPVEGKPTFQAPSLTDENGKFQIEKVTSRKEPPFLMVVLPPAPGSSPLRNAGPPTVPPVPPAEYLPTFVQKPIFTGTFNWCFGQSAPLASDKGILEAVAKYLTSQGRATAVRDFLDPQKFGGVQITWLFLPGPPPLRVPAFGTKLTASAGEVLNIGWAPPGAGPAELQSTRGFYVNASAPVAPLGLTVTLLPPLSGPPQPVKFTIEDPVTDAAAGRPWAFPPLPPLVVPPGLISINELPALVPHSPDQPPPPSADSANEFIPPYAPPPPWVCLR